MNNTAIVEYFENLPVELYKDDTGEIWIAGESIGKALGYVDPGTAIRKIFKRHKNLLVQFSTNLSRNSKGRPARAFNEVGCNIIAMKANTVKSDQFVIWAANILKAYRQGKPGNIDSLKEELKQNRQILERLVLEVSTLKLNYVNPSMIEELPPMDRYNLFNTAMWLMLDRLFPLSKEAQ